jgi:hypothetical protein
MELAALANLLKDGLKTDRKALPGEEQVVWECQLEACKLEEDKVVLGAYSNRGRQ